MADRLRDFQFPGRSEALGTKWMAATSHPLGTFAAVQTLENGGNAVDAAIAASAVLAVVEPSQTGVGGDCMALLSMRGTDNVISLNGSGWTPRAADADWYLERGIEKVPDETAHAVTVPGAPAAWARLIEDHGSMDLGDLLRPAIEYAESGYPVTERVYRDWAGQCDKLARSIYGSRIFLPNGAPPKWAQTHRQPALAKTLREIAAHGADAFYSGWIAEDMVNHLRELGGLHTFDDFAEFSPEYVTPLHVPYRGFEIWECPPNGQGIVSLMMARVLDGLAAPRDDPLDLGRLHLIAETGRIAYSIRDAFVADPRKVTVPVERLLSNEHVNEIRSRCSTHGRANDLMSTTLPHHRETVCVVVVDSDENVVSMMSSLFDDFGSGITAPRSGVLFHNRGTSFVVDPQHPNGIAGRKRPLHTIIPAIMTRVGKVVMPFGVTGGHFQPFGQIQLLVRMIDDNATIQQSFDEPRFFVSNDELIVERTVSQEVKVGLAALGHKVVAARDPLGCAQGIWIDRVEGVLRGASDGRRDGIALGR